MSTRRLRVYELYRTGSLLSCRTATYSYWPNVEVLHVGAYSVRQAYHLAGRGTWGYPLGILECAPRGAPWTHHDGTTSHAPQFRHRRGPPGDFKHSLKARQRSRTSLDCQMSWYVKT